MRLSIIIPCFNSEKYIRRCLDSVYALPLLESEFEVIVIDDCSSDKTVTIVEDYGVYHENLKLVRHLVNRKAGGARNTGMAIATSDIIAFVDSDDEVAPGLFTALRMMEAKGLDLVVMRVEMVNQNGVTFKSICFPYLPDEEFSGIRFQEEHPFGDLGGAPLCLYNKHFLETIHHPFVEGVLFEDADFLCYHFYHAKRVSYCDESCYKYYSNPHSTVHSFSSHHVFGWAFLGARLLAFYNSLDSLHEKQTEFALSVLKEGASFIRRSCHRLIRLRSIYEVQRSYNLLDSHIDRKTLMSQMRESRRFSIWTKLCIRHRLMTTSLLDLYFVLRRMGRFLSLKRII